MKNNVPVPLSSDAHTTTQIAHHFESAIDLLKQIGYMEIAGFNNRNRRMIRL